VTGGCGLTSPAEVKVIVGGPRTRGSINTDAYLDTCVSQGSNRPVLGRVIIIIIIIIERKDLGGVMSKDCKDTLQTLKTVTKRECDAKREQSICQMRSLLGLILVVTHSSL